jgi:putative ABC transport system permease protein
VAALQDPVNAPDVTAVAPVVNAESVSIAHGAATATPATFVGTTPAYLSTNDRAIAEGQSFSDHDVTSRRRVILLGTTVVQNLFGSVDPIGRSVLVSGVSFNVDGVLRSKGSNGTQDQDDIVIAPYTSVQDHVSGGTAGTFNQLVVEAKSSKAIDAAQAEVLSTLDAQHHITGVSSPFSVLNQASLLATSTATNRTFTVLLGAVAAISLLVGGIGVMNIMLVTVTERTREIGIRKALGARRSDVLGQFLTEAVLLSLLGGVAGVALGIALSHFRIDGVRPVVTWFPVVLAFGVSVLVGLFFGIYPANRAAGLRPIEALRRE